MSQNRVFAVRTLLENSNKEAEPEAFILFPIAVDQCTNAATHCPAKLTHRSTPAVSALRSTTCFPLLARYVVA